MEVDTIRAFLLDHPFAQGMRPRQMDAIVGDAQPLAFPADRFIFRQGEPAGKFYIIRSGRVALETRCPSRGTIAIQTLEPGDVLGWSWLVAPHIWQFDARTLDPVEVIVFEAARLRELMATDHELGYQLTTKFLGIVVERLHATRWHLIDSHQGGTSGQTQTTARDDQA